MAKTVIVNGRIYEETGARTAVVGGSIYEETSGGAPPAGPDVVPLGHQRLDNQYSAIAASRINGVLQ